MRRMKKMRKNKYGVPSRIKKDGKWITNPAYKNLLQKDLRKKYPERYRAYDKKASLKPGYKERKARNARHYRAKDKPMYNLKYRVKYNPKKAVKRKRMLEYGMTKEEVGCRPLKVRELDRIVKRVTTKEQYKYLVYGNGITPQEAYPEEYRKKKMEMNLIV